MLQTISAGFAEEGSQKPSEQVVEAKPGRNYAGGTRVQLPAGVSFLVPSDWSGGLPEGSEAFIVGSKTTPGFGMILGLVNVTLEDVSVRLAESQPLTHDLIFEPVGTVARADSILTASYTAGDKAGRALAVIGPSSQAIIYFFGGPAKEAASYERLLARLTASTRFMAAEAQDRAMEIEPGLRYHSGTRVRGRPGISVRVPEGWRGWTPEGSASVYLESPTQPGIGMIVMMEQVSPDDLAARLNEPQVLEEGVVLHPMESVRREDQRLSARYQGAEQIGRALALFGPAREAVLYMLAGPTDRADEYDAIVNRLAASTRFGTPASPAAR